MSQKYPEIHQKHPNVPSKVTNSALLFPNPPLQSLTTAHQHFAQRKGLALKFPREVTPFSALDENTASALADLHYLMEPGEATYVVSFETLAAADGLQIQGPFGVGQFEWPEDAPLPELDSSAKIQPLSCSHAAEMVELTSIAFPGFFRPRTCEMGQYYGIRDEAGRLVAMCGERMAICNFREISGLCTLSEYRGRGYAGALIARLLHDHRAAGLRSYLHVSAGNDTAIALYDRMGFLNRGEFPMYRLTCVGH